MPNKNYLKGVRKERRFVNEARFKNKIAFRSAGSHSEIDVVIIDKDKRVIELIQCKPDNFSELETKRIYDKIGAINGTYEVQFTVR